MGSLTLAVFRHLGHDTIAVVYGGYDPSVPKLYFYRYRTGHWIDITRSVMPSRVWHFVELNEADDGDYNNRSDYVLPRRGTIIVLRDQAGLIKYRLKWRNGCFALI